MPHLPPPYRLLCRAVTGAPPFLYLHEHEGLAVLGNYVRLSVAGSVIPLKYLVAFFFEKPYRLVLAGLADREPPVGRDFLSFDRARDRFNLEFKKLPEHGD